LLQVFSYLQKRSNDMTDLVLSPVPMEELIDRIASRIEDRLKVRTPEPPTAKPDRIDNVKEAAEFTGLSISKFYKLTASGEIPSARYGPRKLIFSRRELEAWMNERTTPRSEPSSITQAARKRVERRSR
jgi:excisionase family DNA binding protein